MEPQTPTANDLLVRRFARHDVALDAELGVASEHAQAVRLSSGVGGRTGKVGVVLTDFSGGGLGIMSTVFLPKQTLAMLRVANPLAPKGPPALETRIRIQRVTMTDRRPGYLLGAVFADNTPEQRASIERFMGLLTGEAPAQSPGEGGGAGA